MAGFEKELSEFMGETKARLEEGNRTLAEIKEDVKIIQKTLPGYMTEENCRRLHHVDEHREAATQALASISANQAAIAQQAQKRTTRSVWPQTVSGWIGMLLAFIALVAAFFGAAQFVNSVEALTSEKATLDALMQIQKEVETLSKAQGPPLVVKNP